MADIPHGDVHSKPTWIWLRQRSAL